MYDFTALLRQNLHPLQFIMIIASVCKSSGGYMEYELYVDVLFLVNFMMDYLVLLLSSRILKINTSYMKIAIGAFTGALCTCIVIIIPIASYAIKLLIVHGVINILMMKIAMPIKGKVDGIKALISLYIASILLGGVAQLFSNYFTLGSLFFALAILSFYIVKVLWFFIENLGVHKQEILPVILYIEDEQIHLKALVDTGNSLSEPLSKKPVSILDKRYAYLMESNLKYLEIKEIPFHTITNKGILKGIEVDRLEINGNKKINKAIIAFSEEEISKHSTYEMILHPEII